MSPMCMCKHAKISHTHFKDPVVHVSVHWITETPNKCQSVQAEVNRGYCQERFQCYIASKKKSRLNFQQFQYAMQNKE